MSSGRFAAAGLLLGFLASCAAPQIHVHDRHVLSYPLVWAFAKSHPGSTLVLLDYHHDIANADNGVTSFNWVGSLLDQDVLSRVVWVSGRTLLLPNRNSRMKWLHRSLEGFAPSDAARIEGHVTLADWRDLRALRIQGPLVVSLDLDILAHDPGDPPERFLDELAAWIREHRPPLVTVALSAAYQKSAPLAWGWLSRLARELSENGASWYMEAGTESAFPESNEENGAWQLWEAQPETFMGYEHGFWPGAGLWVQAPASLREALRERSVRAGDASAQDVLSGWADKDRGVLESAFPPERLERLAASAAASLESAWNGGRVSEPAPGADGMGIAVRLLNDGLDRGCLALYGGVRDANAAARYCAQAAASDPRYSPVRSGERAALEIELSVFGPWHMMANPLDFRPGLDSVLLLEGGRAALLQSSLAVERHYDRGAFLGVLSRKAGLGTDGWKTPGITFKRAATIWYLRPLTAMEQEPSFKAPGPRRK